jgi:stage V sporulation protein B
LTKRTKHSFLHGALILTAAAVIVKIVGALFKIPLNIIIGGDGMGFFSTAYELYMPVYVLSNAGLPVAIARVVAECSASGRYLDARKTLWLANIIFLITGFTGFCIMFFGAGVLVDFIGNPGAYLAVRAMAPTVFFVCLTSAYRGYYEGLQNMYPTALSQVVEVVTKLVLGFGLAMFIYNAGMNGFNLNGTVFGKAYADFDSAQIAVAQYAAAGAILGVSAGALFSALAVFLRHKIIGDKITPEELNAPQTVMRKRTLIKKIVTIAIPVALGSIVGQLTGIIDLFSVLNRLGHAADLDFSAVIGAYKNADLAGKNIEDLPNFLFGCYKGMAVTLYNLIPTFTVAIGISALPPITVAWTSKNMTALKRNVESVLRVTMLLAIPAGIGLSVLSGRILMLLFGSRPTEAAVAAPLLTVLGIAVVFSSACSPINSMLQAIGHAKLPVKIMVVCAAIKLLINYELVGIPGINIMGAAIGTLVCYVLIMVISLIFLLKITRINPDLKSVFLMPLISGLICAAVAYCCANLFDLFMPARFSVVPAIIAGIIAYFAALVLLRVISEEDLRMLPNGEKLVAFYKKLPSIVSRH